MVGSRILAIDDEPDVLRLLCRCLGEAGYEVLTAQDGEEGLAAIRAEQPELIISDIIMPNIDGFELVQMVRSDPVLALTPFMILSGKTEIEDQVKGLELGADEYLTKPFAIELLVAHAKALLRRTELLRQKTTSAEDGPFVENGLEELATYQFENFVVGQGNRNAYMAAKDVAESPGTRFNPLFIYGNPGRGKTHLMCAIANDVYERDSQARALYLTSQVFSDQILSAYENRRIEELTADYLKTDVFIIDDVQFLAVSPSLQIVAAEILAEMYRNDKQIVFSSDRSPQELQSISQDISYRFAVGLVVQITAPDAELRSTILRAKAKKKGWPISGLLLDHIAKRVDSDVRTLEGIVKKLLALNKLRGVPIDKERVDIVISEMVQPGRRVPSSSARRESEPPFEEESPEQEAARARVGIGLVKEQSKELGVVRVSGLPERVAGEMPVVRAKPVVVLGTSGALVGDVVDALGGLMGQTSLIPDGARWVYMVHLDDKKPQWILLGTNQWEGGSALHEVVHRNNHPVFLTVFESPTPRIQEARSLVQSVPAQASMVVAVMSTVARQHPESDARLVIVENMQRLFRVPENVPLFVSDAFEPEQCRKWLSVALAREKTP